MAGGLTAFASSLSPQGALLDAPRSAGGGGASAPRDAFARLAAWGSGNALRRQGSAVAAPPPPSSWGAFPLHRSHSAAMLAEAGAGAGGAGAGGAGVQRSALARLVAAGVPLPPIWDAVVEGVAAQAAGEAAGGGAAGAAWASTKVRGAGVVRAQTNLDSAMSGTRRA